MNRPLVVNSLLLLATQVPAILYLGTALDHSRRLDILAQPRTGQLPQTACAAAMVCMTLLSEAQAHVQS